MALVLDFSQEEDFLQSNLLLAELLTGAPFLQR
jgi:hypothetical protein